MPRARASGQLLLVTRPLIRVIAGDLIEQRDADAWVNPWNRNFVPRRLLLPQGVSGELKRLTGPEPWKELARAGKLELGQAVLTSGGRIPQELIHVAGLNAWWRASERSVRLCVQSALAVALEEGVSVLATPLIGSGSGSLSPRVSLDAMLDELKLARADLEVRVVLRLPR
jgi:O-acetyl-ADP-ribose deacetylase (regulator of RNase III)